MEKKAKSLLAKACAWYMIVYFLLDTFAGKLLFSEPIDWKRSLFEAVFFGIFMTAFNYYSIKNEWFGRKRK